MSRYKYPSNLVSGGFNFSGVENVINFDFPTAVDAYIHRVGRYKFILLFCKLIILYVLNFTASYVFLLVENGASNHLLSVARTRLGAVLYHLDLNPSHVSVQFVEHACDKKLIHC